MPAELPAYLIMIDERHPMDQLAPQVKGGGAPGSAELHWQVRNSVRELVQAPLVLRPQIRQGEVVPDVLFHNQAMFVSDRVKEAMEPWLKDYEFLPARVELWAEDEGTDYGGGPTIEGYWWLNSWRRLDLVDWVKTEAVRITEFPTGFSYPHTPVKGYAWQRLVLRGPAPDDEHFYGLLGMQGEHRYLSEAFHAHLLQQGLGIKFAPKWLVRGSSNEATRRLVNEKLNPTAHG